MKRIMHSFFTISIVIRYATEHRSANKLASDDPWDVPKGFYDRLCNFLPIESSVFFNTIEFITDPMLRQLKLTRIFDQTLERGTITVYERFRNVVETYKKGK